MARTAKHSDDQPKMRPALTPEARENQLIALAVDLAEKKLMDGTASSQVICHYLKLGSTREKLEKELLEKQKELAAAKVDAIHAEEHNSAIYEQALKAMKSYSGVLEEEDEDDSDLY